MRDDGAIRVRRRIVEGKGWDGFQDYVEARTPNRCLLWNTVDAAFQLHPGDNRHENRIVQRPYLAGHVRVAVAKMDRDICVDQIRQA